MLPGRFPFDVGDLNSAPFDQILGDIGETAAPAEQALTKPPKRPELTLQSNAKRGEDIANGLLAALIFISQKWPDGVYRYHSEA